MATAINPSLFNEPSKYLNLVGSDGNYSQLPIQLRPVAKINTSAITRAWNLDDGKSSITSGKTKECSGLLLPSGKVSISDKAKILGANSIRAFNAVDLTATVLACIVLKAAPVTLFGSSAQSIGAILAKVIRVAGFVAGIAVGLGVETVGLIAGSTYAIGKNSVKGSIYLAQKVVAASKVIGTAIKDASIKVGTAIKDASIKAGTAIKSAVVFTGQHLLKAATATVKAAKVAAGILGVGLMTVAKHTAYGLAALVIGSVVTTFDAVRILIGVLLDAKKIIGRDEELKTLTTCVATVLSKGNEELQKAVAQINKGLIERTTDRISNSYSKKFLSNFSKDGHHVTAVKSTFEDLTSFFSTKSNTTSIDASYDDSNDSGLDTSNSIDIDAQEEFF